MSDALAKARLMTVVMRAASKASISATAQALLAIIIAESFPDNNGGWFTRGRIATLCRRLSLSHDSVVRSIRQLVNASLMSYEPGKGTRTSRFSIERAHITTRGESAPVRTPSPHPCGHPIRTRADSDSAAVRTQRHQDHEDTTQHEQQRTRCKPVHVVKAHHPTAHAGVAGGLVSNMVDQTPGETTRLDNCVRFLTHKPDWLPEGKPWIDATTARTIAQDQSVDERAVQLALKLTRERRHTLNNPAGYFIKQLRQQEHDRPHSVCASPRSTHNE